MANTLLNAAKDLRNDSLRELVSESAFTGETPAAAVQGFQGSNYGYLSGANPGGGALDRIDKYSFTSDDNSTDVGDLSVGRWQGAGQSSATHGYASGGNTGGATSGAVDTIDKFPFTSSFTTATDVGNLTGNKTTTSVKVLSLMDMVIILVVICH